MSPFGTNYRGTLMLGPDWLETCRTHDGEIDPFRRSASDLVCSAATSSRWRAKPDILPSILMR
jgi:hypothetical protein